MADTTPRGTTCAVCGSRVRLTKRRLLVKHRIGHGCGLCDNGGASFAANVRALAAQDNDDDAYFGGYLHSP